MIALTQENKKFFINFLRKNEDFLMQRILDYSKKYGYTKYTSTLIQAWRVSIEGLTDSLGLLMENFDSPPQMGPDDSFKDDPACAFGLLEARRHRNRGVNYAMFVSLLKYYKISYLDLIDLNKNIFENIDIFKEYVERFFDRVEIAYAIEWNGRGSEEQIHDLSEQNRAMTNEKNLYLTAFDSFPSPVILVDEKGYVLNYNEVAAKLFFENIFYYYNIHKKIFLAPDWILDDIKYCQNKNKDKSVRGMKTSEGDKIFDIKIRSLNDVSDKFCGHVVVLNDITELEREKESKNSAQEIMIAQSRHAAMGEMIGMIAHQWRQPLSVIAMGANNILADLELGGCSNDDVAFFAKDILEQSRYLSQTIDDFRDFFRPDKEAEEVKIIEIIDEAYKIVEPILRNSNIAITIKNNSLREVKIYSKELLQVIINILKNSKEILTERNIDSRKIKILIEDAKDESKNNIILISICDNGRGIEKEIEHRIFEPYFSTKDQKIGTGLGLYMSKIIVERHLNGKIWFENKNGGTCFYIQIPI